MKPEIYEQLEDAATYQDKPVARVVKLFKYTCKRCGYTWVQRRSAFPRRCANVQCRSPYWQTAAKQGVERVERVPARKAKTTAA